MIRRTCLGLVLCLWPVLATAQSDPAALALTAAENLEAAHLALNEATGAADRVAALTRTVKAYEDGLEALREGMRRATIRESAIRAEFDSESGRVSQLLGVLLSLQPSAGPVALLHPSGPVGSARSGMIVSDIAPALQREAEELRARLEEATLLRELQQNAAATLARGLAGVQTARTELSQAISNRSDLPQRFLADPAEIQTLIQNSETLQGFASGLAGMKIGARPDDAVRNFAAAKDQLPLPVSGTVIRRAGEADAAEVERPGIVLATRPLALVTAPWPATIRYLGPFLDYGYVIILEPDADTLLIMAGMAEIYGETGQVVPAGAALGMMGGAAPQADTFLLDAANGSGSGQSETLYIELRIDDEPVDPAAWFAETKE